MALYILWFAKALLDFSIAVSIEDILSFWKGVSSADCIVELSFRSSIFLIQIDKLINKSKLMLNKPRFEVQ